ncbi:ABC transporter ATP-binding protein [Longirhabdus pacifica]|uniref:ABC transporter ATP-binding protein n=1 Tax=Longirhabdus pacifica TaxID=2305227 RepID=UPI001008A621|nr:ABC transporter ATP-binding protein [Longirhabdus pacifica]
MSQHPLLQVNQLTGGYSLNRPVLHDIDFTLYPGEMVGLLGLNGAGKSTTIKHILGLMKPHQGEIKINNATYVESPEQYRAHYAFVPETPLIFDELTVEEHLQLSAMAYDLSKEDMERRLAWLLQEFNMKPKRNQLASHLSKGMRQKLMIMSAFLVEPKLYIIDEPFLGLDPLGIRSLLDLMVEKKKNGSSILMSSHILSTIEQYCDRFVILHHGNMIANGNLTDLQKQTGMSNARLEDIFFHLVKDEKKHE